MPTGCAVRQTGLHAPEKPSGLGGSGREGDSGPSGAAEARAVLGDRAPLLGSRRGRWGLRSWEARPGRVTPGAGARGSRASRPAAAGPASPARVRPACPPAAGACPACFKQTKNAWEWEDIDLVPNS